MNENMASLFLSFLRITLTNGEFPTPENGASERQTGGLSANGKSLFFLVTIQLLFHSAAAGLLE
jgi:hypothetical protein